MSEENPIDLDKMANDDLREVCRLDFAAAALCGIIQKASGFDPIRHAFLAVDYADALIKALEFPPEK